MRAIETVVIGAGQAGLALSHLLRADGREHVVLERGRVAERWRSERWDSLTLLTPNWLTRLPGIAPAPDPDGFLDRAGVIAQLESYAAGAPVREGTTVQRVARAVGGYAVGTDAGDWHARNVVIATGDCDRPLIPAVAAEAPDAIAQVHSSGYRRPDALAPGGVLVVGAGPSGQQLAAELRRAGRDVTLAVGRHARMPRRYRGRDVFAWLEEVGQLDVRADAVRDLAAARRSPSFPVSGARGGETLGLDRLAELGVVVTGRLEGFSGTRARFAGDLPERVREADERFARALAKIDSHIGDGPGTPAPAPAPAPLRLGRGPAELDLAAGYGSILWCTGYRRAYPWLEVPVLDAAGELRHREGVTPAPGLFALGLRFQRTRKSHFLGGVGEDAAHIAHAIAARSPGALAAAA
jgi:putative flavoprotein involved in K+ transport